MLSSFYTAYSDTCAKTLQGKFALFIFNFTWKTWYQAK